MLNHPLQSIAEGWQQQICSSWQHCRALLALSSLLALTSTVTSKITQTVGSDNVNYFDPAQEGKGNFVFTVPEGSANINGSAGITIGAGPFVTILSDPCKSETTVSVDVSRTGLVTYSVQPTAPTCWTPRPTAVTTLSINGLASCRLTNGSSTFPTPVMGALVPGDALQLTGPLAFAEFATLRTASW
jgi:hypothetical protein